MHSTLPVTYDAPINNKRDLGSFLNQLDISRKSETIKHYKLSQKTPLLSIFKHFVSLHESVTDKTQRARLLAAYDQLLALDDDLLLLILENNVLNGLIHEQRILLEDKSEQFNREERIPIHAGRFEKHMRRVTIVTTTFPDYEEFLIHELTHAAIGFAFSFDPWPVRSRLNLINSKEIRDNIFVDAMVKFRQAPGFPFPAAEETRGRPGPFNAAALKFKHCVWLDLHRYAEPTKRPMGLDFSAYNAIVDDIASVMATLKLMVSEHGYDVGLFQEILPYYIGCRANILKIARENNITTNTVYDLLAEAMPNIHAYCETDFRKVLKYRLEHYRNHFYGEYSSEYLSQHDNQDLHGIKLTFCETGVLRYFRNHFDSQRSSEFSCTMFAHKAKTRVVIQSASIATEIDEVNDYRP